MKDMPIHITTGTIVRALLIIAGAFLLWHLRGLARILLTSIVIATAIEPAAKGLTKYKVPRILSVIIVYLLFFSMFFGVVFF